MKIQYASDLHLEFAENRQFMGKVGLEPVGDILVLAGDVSYLADGKSIRNPFFDWCAANFKETFIVPGNHEFYHGYDISHTLEDYEFKYRPNVRYLNNRSVVIGDLELFFSTLWTRIDPVNIWPIQRGMNDFRHCLLERVRFNVNDVDGIHWLCKDWLEKALKASKASHKIVVTHHCPTIRPEFNGYPDSALNSAFQVNMDSVWGGLLVLWPHTFRGRLRWQDRQNDVVVQSAWLRCILRAPRFCAGCFHRDLSVAQAS